MTLLEDPHQGAERGADRQHVQHHGFERQDHRARQEVEHHVGQHHHEADRERGAVEDGLDDVDVDRGLAADANAPAGDTGVRADGAED